MAVFYAVMDCLCEMHGKQCKEKVQWPQELGFKPPFYFNAGMFVFEPNPFTYHNLLKTLKITPATAFAEQVINLTYTAWHICYIRV